MRHRTGFSTRELTRHVVVYSMGFTLFAAEAVYGTVVSSLVSHFIESEFILQLVTVVEHAVVVVDAVYIIAIAVHDVWNKLNGLFR